MDFEGRDTGMKLIRWIFAIAVLSIWAALIGTALYVAMFDETDPLPEAEAIVVLSGAGADLGGLGPETQARIDRGIALFEAGAAPKLILTGGSATSNPAVAEAMKAAAIEAGVPEDAITVETASLSTLQNALFTADTGAVAPEAPIILVSHRYHLPRANASFRWAGFTDVTNAAADPNGGFVISEGMLWEALKWPYNVVRAAAASAAMAGDVPRESYIRYLE